MFEDRLKEFIALSEEVVLNRTLSRLKGLYEDSDYFRDLLISQGFIIKDKNKEESEYYNKKYDVKIVVKKV